MTKTYSCLLVGVDVFTLEIETVLGNGFSGLNILGLGTEATRDMRERIRSALEFIGIPIPARRVVVNVTPSDIVKISRIPLSQLDFAVAASIIYALYADKEKSRALYQPQKEFLAGELSLSGKLKAVQNPLIYQSAFVQCKGEMHFCLPKENKILNNFYSHQEVEFFSSIQEWYQKRKQKEIKSSKMSTSGIQDNCKTEEVLLLNSEEFKLRTEEVENSISILLKNPKLCVSLLVAALGSHHVLIAGEPGIGKSFSIQKMLSFLNPLDIKEKIEVQLIHSLFHDVKKPFRSPHHSATPAALVGGSSLKPGEVSLAHHGVLFLDELAEFSSSSLEALREPLDSGQVFLSRAGGNIRYPAKFQLCATTNPCPCGFLFSRIKPCRCNPKESRKYLQKISGPLLDRFCLQVWIEPYKDDSVYDIFSHYLLQKVNNGKLKEFSHHYVNTKMKYKENNLNTEYYFNIKKIIQKNSNFLSLSLRGQEKIIKLTNSFQKIFPEIKCDEEFIDSILNYRLLDKMFLQRNIF